MLAGFKKFILRGNVIDLAVAFVIGSVFAALVSAAVSDLITPLIGAIAGKQRFENLKFTLHHSVFAYGDVLNHVISFILIAGVVYFLVVAPLNKVAERRSRGQATEIEVTPDIALLKEIRDLLAREHN